MSESVEKDLPNGVVYTQFVQLLFWPIAADDSFPPERRRSFLEIVPGVVQP